MASKKTLILAAAVLAGCTDTTTTGPEAALFRCALGTGRNVAVGSTLGLEKAGGLCVEAGETGADFVFVPFLAATGSAAKSIQLTGGGLTDPVSVNPGLTPRPRPALSFDVQVAPERRRPDDAFHVRLRERERRELEPRIRAGIAAERRPAPMDVPAVGELLELNTSATCSVLDVRTGEVQAVSEHAIIVVDVENPTPGFEPQDIEFFAATFDTLIYDVETAHFGEPTDIDANGDRAIIFFTRAVNERTPPNSDSFVTGFFWAGDLFPHEDTDRLQACPTSNRAEMFYMLAPDPTGAVNDNPFSVELVRRNTVATIGHEFQHLINASRRLFVNNATVFEEVWLNEGLSHSAEEILFYAATGLHPGMNLDVDMLRSTEHIRTRANLFAVANFGRYIEFLEKPDTASLMGEDNLAMRGAIWSFLRYAADRLGAGDEAFYHDLVDTRLAGLDNLRNVVGDDVLAWMRDWSVAVYADDLVPGIEERYTQPSWDYRSVIGALLPNGAPYPLDLLGLRSGAMELDLLPGGTAYTVFGIPAGQRGVVAIDGSSTTTRDALRGTLLRIR